jgi:hypothetical protein
VALDLLTDNNARGAVALLADAARRHPEDRKIGALLYTLLRDKRWPVGQTLPVKLSAAVTAVDFSSDSKLVIAGTEDGTVRLLDVETSRLLDATVKHPGSVASVAILPGNELAFSVGRAGVARIWRIADGKIEREWSNKESAFTVAAVSKDFKRHRSRVRERGGTHLRSRKRRADWRTGEARKGDHRSCLLTRRRGAGDGLGRWQFSSVAPDNGQAERVHRETQRTAALGRLRAARHSPVNRER